MSNLLCVNDNTPATVVLVYLGQDTIGQALCEACATCTDTACPELGTILDADYEEPWCAHHAKNYADADDPVHGPDIVPIDSERYRQLTAGSPR